METPVLEVNVDDNGVPEKEVVAAHGSKDSEGSETFEEALDEGNDGSRLDSDVGVSASAIEESDADFSVAEGSSRMLGEVEITENLVDVSNEGPMIIVNDDVSNEELSTVDERVVDQDIVPSSIINDDVSIETQGEGAEVIGGDEGSFEKTVVVESSDSKYAGTVAQDDVKDVSTNGDFDNANVMIRELENVIEDDSEAGSSMINQEVKESVEVVPKKILSETTLEVVDSNKEPESRVLHIDHQENGPKTEGMSSDASSYVDVGSLISEPDLSTPSDLGTQTDATNQIQAPDIVGSSMINQNVIDDDSEAGSLMINQEVKESVEVVPEKVLSETKSEVVDSNKEPESRVLHTDHQENGPKTEGMSSDASSSVNGGSLISEPDLSTPSDVGTQTDATNQVQSPDIVARNSQTTAGKKAGKSTDSVAPPVGLGRTAPLSEPAPRTAHQTRVNGQVPRAQTNIVEDTTNGEVEEGDEIREKLQMIRVKFLRLAHRLGQTPHNVVVAQVLYRLGLAEQLRARNGGRVGAFSFDRASAMAEQLEGAGQEPLDFSCTIMVLGKTGVGKSATINSIFDEVKFGTDAFQMGTNKVQDVVGTVQGIKVRVIDTPGLLTSCSEQHKNEKILHSVKRFIKKSPPDIVLYLDRLDMPSRDFCDMPLLRTITEIFGPSIWFNAIVVLTHAASAPPEGPNGTTSTYDMFVTQRSHAVQQVIRQAAGDMRLMNPVSLVENHSACRTNRAGQRVLPNGQVWKPHLLLLSFASKILAEANVLLKLQDTPPGKPFTARSRAPPLPFLLSSLLQSRPQLKLPEEQYGDDDGIDDDLDETTDSDEESEYDELPPFKPLTKTQLAKLPKAQAKAYYDELEYREKLFMKKQLKEEKRRRKMMKKMTASAKDVMPTEYNETAEEETGGAASLPVTVPDLPLPASFDSDNPTHRYRYLDTSNQWLIRPVLDNHGWDHDVGYEGINVERMFAVKDKIPVSFSGQISKDKKEANLQMEVASSIKHGEGKATTMGFDLQSVGKDMAYTLRSESRISNYRWNKLTAGLSGTLIGDSLSAGFKVEDKLIINNQMRVVMSGGAMTGRGDVAYGGSFEATYRDKDYPVGRFLSSLGLSIMDWHGELALGFNIQSNIPMGRGTNMVARANLNNRGSGQVSLRLNSTEQIQLALIAFLPLIRKIISQYQDHPVGY